MLDSEWFDMGDQQIAEEMGFLDSDLGIVTQPTMAVLMHRATPHYTEAMWIRGYAWARMISVVALPVKTAYPPIPGVIRNIAIGAVHLASPTAFRNRFYRVADEYERHGWIRKPTDVGTW